MKGHRISFFVHDLAANPIVRAAPLARALQQEFDIEILGLLLSGDQVFAPFQGLFDYQVMRSTLDIKAVLANSRLLARRATGDIIYAFKPLLTSFGPALRASGWGRRKPLLLDAEDDEWITWGKSPAQFVYRDLLKGWRHATAWKYTRALHYASKLACEVTVSSRKLQERYGGVILRHGPDETAFNPDRPELSNTETLRERFRLPRQRKLALFAGMPQPHKDLELLAAALMSPACENWDLVLAGPPDHPQFLAAAQVSKQRCHILGVQPQASMPQLVSAIDAIPVPQKKTTFTESQLPAKALEGMAMARPVVASRVGDLPEILGEGLRGWLYEPDDAAGLAAALCEIEGDPVMAQSRSRAGRAWFLENASTSAIHDVLQPLIRRALAVGKH